jgi:large subunit ribosomal protein L32
VFESLGVAHFGDQQACDYRVEQSSPVRPQRHAARHPDPKSHIEELGPTMAVPKRRMSRSNTRSRRAQWKATRTELVGVTVAGQKHKVPRRLLKAARLGLVDLDRR